MTSDFDIVLAAFFSEMGKVAAIFPEGCKELIEPGKPGKKIKIPEGTPRPGGKNLLRLGAGKPPGGSTISPFSGNKMKLAAVKEAGRQIPQHLLEEITHSLLGVRNPPEDLVGLKRMARAALRSPDGSYPVPLAQRLQNYQHWKATEGTLPNFAPLKGRLALLPREKGRGLRYVNSSEQVALHSGGAAESLQKAQLNPRTSSNSLFLRPGQLRTERRGLYMTPDEGEAFKYTGKGEGSPAVLSAKVPLKSVVREEGGLAGGKDYWFLPGTERAALSSAVIKKATVPGPGIEHILGGAGVLGLGGLTAKSVHDQMQQPVQPGSVPLRLAQNVQSVLRPLPVQ